MREDIVQAINGSGYRLFFAITGGGQSFLGDYFKFMGASQAVVGAIIPYSNEAFYDFTKNKVDSYASEEAARKLSVAAFNKAVQLGNPADKSVGVGMACSLEKANERKGREHRIFISIHREDDTQVMGITLQQGRSRIEEDEFAAKQLLQQIAEVLRLNVTLYPLPLREGETFYFKHACADHGLGPLVKGEEKDIAYNIPRTDKLLVYPGSWNPLHNGHEEIVKIAEEVTGIKAIFELSIANADKGQLDYVDLMHRASQFVTRPHIFTRASTFIEKVNLLYTKYHYNQLFFIVGADTWERIWDEAYGYSIGFLKTFFHEKNVEFLVFPRGDKAIWKTVAPNLIVDDPRIDAFKNDLSSSIIRKKQ